MSETPQANFAPIEFIRQGPPVGVRDLHRQETEKWSRIMMVTPRPLETSERTRYDFVEKGPLTLPLAVRREGADVGSLNAWQFFTHPYTVFPDDATFFNVPGNGCLGARIFQRTEHGVHLYDEVGAGIEGSQRVSDSFHGALGVLRHMALGDLKKVSQSPLAEDLFELDLDLLELFNLAVQLLRDENPLKALSLLYPHLLKPSVHHFAWDAFDEKEHDIMRALADGESSSLKDLTSTFRVIRRDFTRITDVRDAKGKQAILQLLQEWEAFEQDHGVELADLSRKLQAEEAKLDAVRQKVAQLQRGAEQKSRVTRFFARTDQNVKALKAEAVRALRAKRELEQAFDEIPGYTKLQGLSERVKDFEHEIRRVFDMAQNMIKHTVTREEIESLRAVVKDKLMSEDESEVRSGYRQYDLRLRAEILPKLLQTYSLSAYVLRRPDAMTGAASRRNVHRINDLARRLIEYFRYCRYGKSTLGAAYDETWGQVVSLESQL